MRADTVIVSVRVFAVAKTCPGLLRRVGSTILMWTSVARSSRRGAPPFSSVFLFMKHLGASLATNQEVARSSRAGRTNPLRMNNLHSSVGASERLVRRR